MTKCRSCKSPLVFGKSEKTGKFIPLDPTPVPFGNLEAITDEETPVVRFVKPSMARHYKAHFVTCPAAKEHRKPKPTPEPAQPVRKARRKDEPTKAQRKAEQERIRYEEAMHGA